MLVRTNIYCTVLGCRVLKFTVSHRFFRYQLISPVTIFYFAGLEMSSSFMSQFVFVVVAEGHF